MIRIEFVSPSGRCLACSPGDEDTRFVIDLAYCDINKILLSASGDCTVRAWSLEGREICSGNVLEDLPNDIPDRTISPTAPADGSDEASQPHMQDNRHRPSIRQMSYFQQCSLLFVAVERSPSILVYRLELRSLQNSMVEGSLHHVTTLEGSDNTRASVPVNPTIGGRGSVEEVTQETAEPGSVAGLCVQAYRLWVLRQQADKLSLAVYTICVEQDNEVKITPSSSESKESEIVKTVSQQNSFLRVQSAAEDLLPFLWKANFQEDFKLQCNLKRGSKVKETVEIDSKGELDKKKAKIGENGR
ncbi:hypothetical protein RRG08_031318 [Elysia crispata]|uniref:Uncharacterized protein n=1 Tax=Elysia crispata TaxID=231223 RepID=A0AAE1CZT5_9GAST|nr:hypothetical protein RRG08_031318 [Elysia crispata]